MRQIKSADNLIAHVEGDIGEVDGVLRITAIRLQYKLAGAADKRDVVQRVMDAYAEKCPAYQSIKGCIECTWDIELSEAGA